MATTIPYGLRSWPSRRNGRHLRLMLPDIDRVNVAILGHPEGWPPPPMMRYCHAPVMLRSSAIPEDGRHPGGSTATPSGSQ